MRHYMPGCDVAKNHPREIKAIQHYMVEKSMWSLTAAAESAISYLRPVIS